MITIVWNKNRRGYRPYQTHSKSLTENWIDSLVHSLTQITHSTWNDYYVRATLSKFHIWHVIRKSASRSITNHNTGVPNERKQQFGSKAHNACAIIPVHTFWDAFFLKTEGSFGVYDHNYIYVPNINAIVLKQRLERFAFIRIFGGWIAGETLHIYWTRPDSPKKS